MSYPASEFILQSRGSLSERAFAFLRATASRAEFDPGLTGGDLRDEIFRVYGTYNDPIVLLLDNLQNRYGGLTYQSGFFDAVVTFSPVCEPEDPAEDLEVLYAVETGSPAGASIKPTGEVEVGVDGEGVIEFPSLDTLIECDSMFGTARKLPHFTQRSIDNSGLRRVTDRLNREFARVSEASGQHCSWFENSSGMVFVNGSWAALELGMSPTVSLWSRLAYGTPGIEALVA